MMEMMINDDVGYSLGNAALRVKYCSQAVLMCTILYQC